jgi:hypothetical protein
MELYVDEHRWKSLDTQSQLILNQFIVSCEEQIVPILKVWNHSRSEVLHGLQPENENILKVKIPKFRGEIREPLNW